MSRQSRFQTLFGGAQRRSTGTRPASRRPSTTHVRRLNVEHLEERAMLSATDFELSSLLPANGGDGSNGFVVSGIIAGGNLGGFGQPVGDVNQDGIDDLLLGAPAFSNPLSGGDSYLVFGRPGGVFPVAFDLHSLDGTNGYVIHDSIIGDRAAGNVCGGAGDLNHDGFLDIAIGAGSLSPSAGHTFVLYGGVDHLASLDLADGVADGRIDLFAVNGTDGFVINGAATGDIAYRPVGVGDVNGDHVDDLAINTAVGKVFVVFGRDSTVGNNFLATFELSTLVEPLATGSDGFVIPAIANSLGVFPVAPAGDVNGDGMGDLVFGVPYASPLGRNYAGQAFVVFGQSSFPATFNLASLNGGNGFTVNGKGAMNTLGYSVSGAGDVNGDGVADVVIGGPGSGTGNGGGEAYVIFGKTTATSGSFPAVLDVSQLNGANGFTLAGAASPLDGTGTSVRGAGDVNNDGYDDVLVGSYRADPNGVVDAGQAYVVYGGPSFGASYNVANLSAAGGGDGSAGYVINGFLTGQKISLAAVGDINHDGFADLRFNAPYDDPNGLTDAGRAFIVYGKASPAPTTKFYVVNDGASDRTYEYSASGGLVESYNLNSGNTAPRGAASTIAGDKTWVVDANGKVYVYNTSGGLLGSWTAGTLPNNATVEGIATNGSDVWIVDAKSDKVYKYTGAATRLSGSQNAVSSFNLNSGNTSPKDIVTDGASLWVVNDASTDKVFKYTVAGSLLGSWTISTSGASSPTGITINPANVSDIWIVDAGSDKVYQYTAAATRISGSQAAAATFALAAGNTNPQGIADPPTGLREPRMPTFGMQFADTATVNAKRPSHDARDLVFAALVANDLNGTGDEWFGSTYARAGRGRGRVGLNQRVR